MGMDQWFNGIYWEHNKNDKEIFINNSCQKIVRRF